MDNSELTLCDVEPIHTPGAIQEFGAILAVEPDSLKITQASANCEIYFGISPQKILGQSITELFGNEIAALIVQRSNRISSSSWSANVYYQKNLILIEAEKTSIELLKVETAASDRLQNAESLIELLNSAVESIFEITNFDRVMIYRFHDDLHGEVVTEKVRDGVESYLGLHYPATDIPQPARDVFLKNWVRMIPDVNYLPVSVIPLIRSEKQKPLDLGVSLLRAVSPVHIEYLKNMGVNSSLTISLVVDGKLWGLIACHHLQGRYVSLSLRDACETLGRLISAFIAVRIAVDTENLRISYRKVHHTLVSHLEEGLEMSIELTKPFPNLLDLIHSAGSSAALYLEGYWAAIGRIPSTEQLESLVDWLKQNHSGEAIFSTHRLASVYEGAKDFDSCWTGLMAISIPKSPRHFVLWFRPEFKSTVNWAGNPEKKMDETGRIHPRKSFASWCQTVSGESAQWTSLEKEAALELRAGIIAVDLKRMYHQEQESRIEAERATKAREELMVVLSHDLRNPIGSIRLGIQFAKNALNSESNEQVASYLSRIEKTTVNMDRLISDILSITKLEAGHTEIMLEKVCIDEVLTEVTDLLLPIAEEKNINLQFVSKAERAEAMCNRVQIIQVVSNLLGNAIKFTPQNGNILVSIISRGPESIRFMISDDGPGIPVGDLQNVFDRFWQAQKTKQFGTGLGLAIVKGIVDAHHGKVWAESDGKTGSKFIVNLPCEGR